MSHFILAALAVVAASGAAFAQSSVTLSGKFGYGYSKAQGGVSGLVVTDGDLGVTAVEDLGGGLKATAAAAFTNRGRQSAIAGRDATVSLAGGFGTVTVGNIEAGNGIVGRGFAGAPVALATGYDGAILDGAANADIISYSAPAINGVVFSVKRLDSVGFVDTAGANGAQREHAKQRQQQAALQQRLQQQKVERHVLELREKAKVE